MEFQKTDSYYSEVRLDLLSMLPSFEGSFLEIGCGAGGTLEYLRQHGAKYVAGIDIHPASVEAAQRKGIDLAVCLNVERSELPFSDGQFDCIILVDILEHLYDPWSMLQKLRRLMANDGRMLLS